MSDDKATIERQDAAAFIAYHLRKITGDHTWDVSSQYGWQSLIYNSEGKGLWMSNAAKGGQWFFNQSPIKLPGYTNGIVPSRTETLSANISKEKPADKIAAEVYRRLVCEEKSGFWEAVKKSIKNDADYEAAAAEAFGKLKDAGFIVQKGFSNGEKASNSRADTGFEMEGRVSVKSWGSYGFYLEVSRVTAEQAIAIAKAIGAVK